MISETHFERGEMFLLWIFWSMEKLLAVQGRRGQPVELPWFASVFCTSQKY